MKKHTSTTDRNQYRTWHIPPPQFLYLCVFVFWFSLTVINVTVVIMMRSFVSGLIRFSFKYRARICWEAVH